MFKMQLFAVNCLAIIINNDNIIVTIIKWVQDPCILGIADKHVGSSSQLVTVEDRGRERVDS